MVGTRSRVRRYIPRRSFLVPLRTRTRAIGSEALRFSNAGSRGRKNKSHRRPQRSQSIGEELAATRRLQTESLMGAQNGIHAGRLCSVAQYENNSADFHLFWIERQKTMSARPSRRAQEHRLPACVWDSVRRSKKAKGRSGIEGLWDFDLGAEEFTTVNVSPVEGRFGDLARSKSKIMTRLIPLAKHRRGSLRPALSPPRSSLCLCASAVNFSFCLLTFYFALTPLKNCAET